MTSRKKAPAGVPSTDQGNENLPTGISTTQPTAVTIDIAQPIPLVHIVADNQPDHYTAVCGATIPKHRAVHPATGRAPKLPQCYTCAAVDRLGSQLDRMDRQLDRTNADLDQMLRQFGGGAA